MELWSLGARAGDAALNVQRSLPNGELCDPGTYATLERRRWISTPSTITKSAPATIWMIVTLLMAISFHEKSNTGFNYARVDYATRRLRSLGATALDQYSQHDHEKHTGDDLDSGDAHVESPFLSDCPD